MTTIVAFLVKDADEDEQAGVIIRGDRLSFSDIQSMVNHVGYHSDLRDKFDLPMADYEPTLGLESVDGVMLGQFVYHNVSRRNWAVDVVEALIQQHPELSITRTSASALATMVRSTMKEITLMDLAGEWQGIACVEV